MLANNTVYKFSYFIAVLLCVMSASIRTEGGVGGGSGEPDFPYDHNQEYSEEDVSVLKNITARTRVIRRYAKETNGIEAGKDVGLMYVEGNKLEGDPFFHFEGVDQSGNRVQISFSNIALFSLLEVDKRLFKNDRALLKVVVFPDIFPKELLKIQPSYSELKEKYRKKVELWVVLEDSEGRALCLVGKNFEGEYGILSKVSDIKLKRVVKLDYGRPGRAHGDKYGGRLIWWAILSVVKDGDYPYRFHIKL